jgi:hypothetical protein
MTLLHIDGNLYGELEDFGKEIQKLKLLCRLLKRRRKAQGSRHGNLT